MAYFIRTPAKGQIWQHYKGATYRIIGIAWDGCTDRPSVVYGKDSDSSALFVRDLGDWLASVDYSDDKVPRFRYVQEI